MKSIRMRITLMAVFALAALAVAWGLLLASRSRVALATGLLTLDPDLVAWATTARCTATRAIRPMSRRLSLPTSTPSTWTALKTM